MFNNTNNNHIINTSANTYGFVCKYTNSLFI